MAIKDEYEVARLYTDGDFLKRIAAQFEGDYKLNFHLAPPLSNKPDPVTGEAKKSTYGPWMMTAFRVLAKMKWLRGTALDVFGKTHERRTERRLITDYEALIDELLPRLAAHNHAIAAELASIPEHIRGYGHVKDRHLKVAKAKETELVASFRAAAPGAAAALIGVAPVQIPEEVRQQVRASLATMLADALARTGAAGETRVMEGEAANAIVACAEELGAELVVVGTHGRTGLRRLALGSVAERVVRNASCSVLTVR
jgi:nucleotide-binding universal stress UspA family protein